MFGILGLGFLLGMQHALEADHIAAVSSIAARRSHAGETAPHARTVHAHDHGFRWRTLLVGLMHGMAGSAALLVLTVTQASSPAAGLGYIALFGAGSMTGMGALSTVIAVPLAVSARWLTWANRALQGAVGLATVAIGIMTVVEAVLA